MKSDDGEGGGGVGEEKKREKKQDMVVSDGYYPLFGGKKNSVNESLTLRIVRFVSVIDIDIRINYLHHNPCTLRRGVDQ